MMTLMEILFIMLAGLMLNISNPVKMRVVALFLGRIILLMATKITGLIWINLVLFLLFMGGILVVFIIISSVAPNEAPIKIKKFTLAPILLTTIYLVGRISLEQTGRVDQVKSILVERKFLTGIILIISIYFFLFINILSRKEISMRTFC